MRAYDLLTSIAAGPPALIPPPSSYERQTSVPKSRKRRPAHGEDLFTPTDGTNQSQRFATINTLGDHAVSRAAASPFHSTGEPPQKKRGRPNKEEHERRVREAAERGETYPPPKKIRTQRPSLEGTVEGVTTPSMTHEPFWSNQEAKKPQGAPASESLAPEIPVRTSSLEVIASAAGQTSTEIIEATRSTVTESSPSDFPPRESLLTGMQEYAAIIDQAEPDAGKTSASLETVPASQSEIDVLPPSEGTKNPPTDTDRDH